MKKNLHLLFLFAVSAFLFKGCVKDTDFNQTDDIALATVLELDFIFFNINSQNFTDLGINNTIVSDTTDLDFLDSEIVSENIWETIEVENTNDDLLPFLLTIPLQKLAYYSALKKGFDIDKPRNLAKSVTVE